MKTDHLTPREIDGEIAIHFFGWTWHLCNKQQLAALFPPDTPEWIRWNYGPTAYTELGKTLQGHKKFTDWFECGGPSAPNRMGGYDTVLDKYSENMNSTWKLVAKLHDLEYSKFRIDISHYHGCSIHFCHDNNGDIPRHIFVPTVEEVPLAICRAALQVIPEPSEPVIKPDV